jgi:hypothetical protein
VGLLGALVFFSASLVFSPPSLVLVSVSVSFRIRVPHDVRGRHGPRQVPHDFPREAVQMGTHVVPRGPRVWRLAASVAADAFRALAGRVQVTPHRVRPGVFSVAVARRPRPLTTKTRVSGLRVSAMTFS